MLHRIEPPPAEAEHLRGFNTLLDLLLDALCEPATTPAMVTADWLVVLWPLVPEDWVRAMCDRVREGESALTLMKAVAGASPAVKAELLAAFQSDRDAEKAYGDGSTHRAEVLPACAGSAVLRGQVKRLFQRFYDPEFDPEFGLPDPANGNGDKLTRPGFVAAFCDHNKIGVCPYCDGSLSGTRAKLDHILPKESFPFLSVTPDNLVPACTDCNSIQIKGRKIPLSQPPANAATDWFHPYHRSADGAFNLGFLPPRANDEPRCVTLTNADAAAQRRLDNLEKLLGIAAHWSERLPHEVNTLVKDLRARLRKGKAASVAAFLDSALDTAEAGIRNRAYSILNASVCRASIAEDSQFRAELDAVFAAG